MVVDAGAFVLFPSLVQAFLLRDCSMSCIQVVRAQYIAVFVSVCQ